MAADQQKTEINKLPEEITFRELILKLKSCFALLLKKWLIIFGIGLVGGVLGLVYALTKKPVFVATTTFVLEDGDKTSNLGGLGGLASLAGFDIGGGGGGIFTGENILELYRSRLMLEKTLLSKVDSATNSKRIIDFYIEANDLKSRWKDVNWDRVDFSDKSENTILRDSIIREVVKSINKNNLSVFKPDKKLSSIKVVYKSENEKFAKTFSDALVSSVNNYYVTSRTEKTTKNVEILQHKTDSVRKVMVGDIYRTFDVSDATPNQNPVRQAQRGGPVQTAQFSAETNKVILAELVKNLELAKLNLLKETPLIQLIDEPILPLEVIKVGKAKGILIGGILASLLACIYILGRYYLNRNL